jgi:hypothetical protein
MIAILTGDIVDSRKLDSPEIWILPLKSLLGSWGSSPETWEIYRGDSFQLEISDPQKSLLAALQIKALIKSLENPDPSKRTSPVDVRMAIGIGEKTYEAHRISESNGPAFVRSGELFETLKNEGTKLALTSPWPDFDREINLILKLASIQMDSWSISSGELLTEILRNPDQNQTEMGKKLGIGQNAISKRFKAANASEILDIEAVFRDKLIPLLK